MPPLTNTASIALAMLCPMYIDTNTSSLIMTHKLGSTVVFTRYSDCISETAPEFAEGSWRVARASIDDGNFSDRIVADYGFHEKGKMVGSSIFWTNGAVWRSRPQASYYTEEGLVSITPQSDDGENYDVTLNGETVGVLRAMCDQLFFNARRGVVKGDFVAWDDGDVWWPMDEPSLLLEEDDYYDYDEDYETFSGDDADYYDDLLERRLEEKTKRPRRARRLRRR